VFGIFLKALYKGTNGDEGLFQKHIKSKNIQPLSGLGNNPKHRCSFGEKNLFSDCNGFWGGDIVVKQIKEFPIH
jgi:hypothetical protein